MPDQLLKAPAPERPRPQPAAPPGDAPAPRKESPAPPVFWGDRLTVYVWMGSAALLAAMLLLSTLASFLHR
jgi:hypothetical protein